MSNWYLLFLILGAVCFLVNAWGKPVVKLGSRPLALLPLGLLFWILVPLVETWRVVFND